MMKGKYGNCNISEKWGKGSEVGANIFNLHLYKFN